MRSGVTGKQGRDCVAGPGITQCIQQVAEGRSVIEFGGVGGPLRDASNVSRIRAAEKVHQPGCGSRTAQGGCSCPQGRSVAVQSAVFRCVTEADEIGSPSGMRD